MASSPLKSTLVMYAAWQAFRTVLVTGSILWSGLFKGWTAPCRWDESIKKCLSLFFDMTLATVRTMCKGSVYQYKACAGYLWIPNIELMKRRWDMSSLVMDLNDPRVGVESGANLFALPLSSVHSGKKYLKKSIGLDSWFISKQLDLAQFKL